MPERNTIRRAQQKQRKGDRPTTQAGEFVREEIDHIRQRKHGARSTKQAIAIGLSKARRAGVKLPPPKKGAESTRRKAKQDFKKGRRESPQTPSRRRSQATLRALKREPGTAASRKALSRQARQASRRRRKPA